MKRTSDEYFLNFCYATINYKVHFPFHFPNWKAVVIRLQIFMQIYIFYIFAYHKLFIYIDNIESILFILFYQLYNKYIFYNKKLQLIHSFNCNAKFKNYWNYYFLKKSTILLFITKKRWKLFNRYFTNMCILIEFLNTILAP